MSALRHHNVEHGLGRGNLAATLVAAADIEVIPLRSAYDKLAAVPVGTTVTVTCSAKLGLDRTLDYSIQAAAGGYRVIPHLAARQLTGETELRRFVGRLGEAGITDLYVIGGDATPPAGPYGSALEVLETLAGIQHSIQSIGVACYPEGHPAIDDPALLEALRRKALLADYMVSQLCFSPDALVGWLRKIRAVDIRLPLHIGLAAPLEIRKLAQLSLQIGVGSSVRYLTKQHGLLGNVIRGGAYQPDQLLLQMGDALAAEQLAIERVHIFSFNQIDLTVDWQRRVTGAPISSR